MFDDWWIKTYWDLKFKIFDHASLLLEYKEFCEALVHAPINFLINSKQDQNEEDMGLKLKRGLELFFQKLWTKLLFIFFLCFLHCSIIFNVQRTFVAFKFVCPTTQKLFNLINEWRKYWKCSMINTWWWVVLPYHSKICSFF